MAQAIPYWQNVADVIVQLGAGTALPSCVLFREHIREKPDQAIWAPKLDPKKMTTTRMHGPRTFIVADYNASVLRYAAFPNMFLNWAAEAQGFEEKNIEPSASAIRGTDTFLTTAFLGYVEITEQMKTDFKAYLKEHEVNLVFIAGAWSGKFDELA